MSYSLSLAADARAALSSLDLWLQEETLDEIEGLLKAPAQLGERPGDPVAVHDFIRVRAERTHYVFLTLRADHGARQLDVLSIGHVER